MPTNLITLERTYFDGFSLSWGAVSGAVKYHVNLVGRGPWATSSYSYETTDTSLVVRLTDWENAYSITVSSEDAGSNITPIDNPSLCRTSVDHGIVVIIEDTLEYLENWLNMSAATEYPSVTLSASGCASVTLPSFGSSVTKFALVMAEGDGYNAIPYPKTEDMFLFVNFPQLARETVSFQIIPFLT